MAVAASAVGRAAIVFIVIITIVIVVVVIIVRSFKRQRAARPLEERR